MKKDTSSPAYRTYVMVLLVVVYTFNFVDRQIVGILAVPIKADLGLSDTELGLMGGLAFALFYTTLGIPIAMLADRGNRTLIMTAALTVWSAMTAVCGLANSFWQLFFARLGVGIGEAGGVTPAYSLISDYFPSHQRARALSIYSFGIPIGSALGMFFGGYIATHIDWRFAFFAVGFAGILVAPIFKATVKEPPRGQHDHATAGGPASLIQILRFLVRKPSFWITALGAASSSIMGYGSFFWLPSFFVRSFDMQLIEASMFYGAIVLVGGLCGIWFGGSLADRYGATSRRAYVLVPAIAFVVTVPFYVVAIMSTNLVLTFCLMLLPTALGLMWVGPVLSAVQHIVPPNMRATASAVFLFINNLIGIGLGTVLLGVISDNLKAQFGDDSLRYAILAGTGFYVLAAVLFYGSSKLIAKDWEEQSQAS